MHWVQIETAPGRVRRAVRFRVKSTNEPARLDLIDKVAAFPTAGIFGCLLFHAEPVRYKADSHGITKGAVEWLAESASVSS